MKFKNFLNVYILLVGVTFFVLFLSFRGDPNNKGDLISETFPEEANYLDVNWIKKMGWHKGSSLSPSEEHKTCFYFLATILGLLGGSSLLLGLYYLANPKRKLKKIEEALLASAKRYVDLANLLPGIVFEADREGNITFASQRAFEIMGYSPEDIEDGLNIFQFISSEHLPMAREMFKETLYEEKSNLRLNLQKKDGSLFPALIHTSPILRDGYPFGLRGVVVDITDLVKIQEDLMVSEKKAQELAKENEIIAEIGQIITSSIDINDIFEKFAEKARELINFDRIAINVIDHKNSTTTINYVWGPQIKEREEGKIIPLGGTGVEWVMKNRRSLVISEENREEIIKICPGLWPALQSGLKSMILTPMFSRDQVIGVLNIQSFGENSFIEKDLEVAERVSHRIAGAVANALLFEEHRKVEEALRSSEFKYRELVSSLPEVVFEADEAGNLLFVNERAFETFGYSRGDFEKGLNAFEMLAPEDCARAKEFYQKVMHGEKSGREYKLRRKDGSIFHGIIYAKPIIYNGIPSGLRGIIIDITDRKQLEEHLKESRERYRTLFENTGTAFVVIEEDMTISLANSKAEELTGYSREEISGKKKWTEFIVPEDLERLKEYHFMRRINPDLAPQSYETKFITKDGETKEILINIAMIPGTKTSIASILDITELKRKEREVSFLQEQFAQAQKMEAVGRLAGGIAHDFNNSLTLIKISAQMAQMELKEGDSLRERINTIIAATDRSANLARQLLAFSRKQIMEMKVIDLNLLIKDLDKMLHRVIGEDIELIYELAEDLHKVKVDPGQIEQVILNLTLNSRDAMPQGGKLIIETANTQLDEDYARSHLETKVGKYVMLSVTDTGIGMAPEVKAHLFEPFFTTKEKGKGTGLGLSTVYGIVKQSNGHIWVYSEPGKGSTFKIYLPVVEEPAEEVRRREEGAGILKGHETILVVEDEDEVRKMAGNVLEKLGYKVLTASCAEEAFNICDNYKEPIHLLLTDVIMPGRSGRDLAEAISKLRPETKVLYMSGYPDEIIGDHGVLKPGINYLPKPFTVAGLASNIREVLDRK